MYTTTGIKLTTGQEPNERMHFHLVGIGGAGMSALARWLHRKGIPVSGSDLHESPTLQALRELGIHAYSPHDPEQMGQPEWLVVSDAIHPDNPEVITANRLGIPIWRRSQLLGWLLRGHKVIAVTGTHGKSTTTAMLARILEQAGYDPIVVIGADVPDGEPWMGNLRLGNGEWAVVEACEAYESYLDFNPDIAVVTNIEADHLDHHGTFERLQESFMRFCQQVKRGGQRIACGDSMGVLRVCERLHGIGGHERPPLFYGFAERNDLRAEIVERTPQLTRFRLQNSQSLPAEEADYTLQVPGEHNVQNALGAIAVAHLMGIPAEPVREALASFRGVKRRQEVLGEIAGITVVDDYAHHPTEIRATVLALRQRFPERRLVIIYQPHLYSRTRDQLQGLIDSLAQADFVVVTDIYPAREKPIPGISSALIADGLLDREDAPPTLYVPVKEQIPSRLLPHLQPGDVVVTMGAGDVEQVAPLLLARLESGAYPSAVLATGRKLRIAVLMGGDSPERDVSLLSGHRVMQVLNPDRYDVIAVDPALVKGKEGVWGLQDLLLNPRPDLALIVLHGRHGEDGAVQGLLELLGIPYTGSGVLASALAMNKNASKIVLMEAGITVPKGLLVHDNELETLERIQAHLRLPLIVKPNQGGSTLGTTRVWEWNQLERAVRKALGFDSSVLVEELITGTEVSVPVLGTRQPEALPPVEIVPRSGYYDFHAKYVPGETEEIVPARLQPEVLSHIQDVAVTAHLALGCRGMSRVDMIVQENTPFVLEVNTIPGLTPTSLLPRSAEAAGIHFEQLINRLIEEALETP
ncbi:MAG: UDP-N-acetylmuramate--L-alanine ligase [Fimbriimonadales bacterium]